MTELYFTMEEDGKETISIRESKRRERQAGRPNPVYLLKSADMVIFIDKISTFGQINT